MISLKMSYPQDYASKLFAFSSGDECMDDTLYNSFNEIFNYNPVMAFFLDVFGSTTRTDGVNDALFQQ